jgi:hypothetical protein
LLGSSIPYDKAKTLESFANGMDEDLIFLSVDWSGDWLDILDIDMLNQYNTNTKKTANAISPTSSTSLEQVSY